MKRKFTISAVLLSAAFGLSLYPSIGYAQTSNHSALTVKVPFEFVVGNQAFPGRNLQVPIVAQLRPQQRHHRGA